MDNYIVHNIAAAIEPEQREGSTIPGVSGTESLTRGKGTESPWGNGLQYDGRSIGREDHSLGGVGTDEVPTEKELGFMERNRILEEEWNLQPVYSPRDYFDILFSRVNQKTGESVNYLQATGPEFYGDHHYNAIVYDLHEVSRIDKKTGKTFEFTDAKKYDITRTKDKCSYIEGPGTEVVISSPVLYAGRTRTARRARTIWGIAIDLDDVSKTNLNDLAHWIFKLEYTPMPSMIVSSGGGLHLYYLFPMGVKCYPQTIKLLQRLKHNMAKTLWSPYFSSNKNPQLGQGIWQGFRIPGTPTKMKGYNVVGFIPEEIHYYTVKELNDWFKPEFEELIGKDDKPLTDEETNAIDNNEYIPSKLSRPEAMIKYPDWNPDNRNHGQWKTDRHLYDWWLKKLKTHDTAVTTGHRYSCLMALVSFARKCQVPYEEVEQDVYSCVEWLDSLTTDPNNHFKMSDANDALSLYNQDGVVRYTRRYIEYHTGIKAEPKIKRNTKENRLPKESQIKIAALKRDLKYKDDDWRKKPRKTNKGKVLLWCAEHPYVGSMTVCAKDLDLSLQTVSLYWPRKQPKTIPGSILNWRKEHPENKNKSLCARECGVSRPTVNKWWDCTEIDVEEEKARHRTLHERGLEAINNSRNEPAIELDEEYRAERTPYYGDDFEFRDTRKKEFDNLDIPAYLKNALIFEYYVDNFIWLLEKPKDELIKTLNEELRRIMSSYEIK